MRVHFLTFLALLFAFCNGLEAQPQNGSSLGNKASNSMHLLYDQPPTSLDMVHGCRHLMLDIDATGFFFNAEYATPFAKGYTVVGFRLSPTLAFGINEKAQLRVGFNASMFAGLDSLYKPRPTLSLIYKPSQWLTLVAGTIYGGYSHQLAMPVYDPSRWIYNYQEDGLQILTHTKFWESDTWLDWSHYLTPWTADQERFTMGTKHLFSILRHHKTDISDPSFTSSQTTKKILEIDLPTHFIASHRGGEVKTIDTNTVTTFNERIGLRVTHTKTKDLESCRILSLDLPYYHYHLDNSVDNGGGAFYPTLSYEIRKLVNDEQRGCSAKTTIGFWHGEHYFSALGSPLFWSANSYSMLHIPASSQLQNASDNRNIITLTANYEHEFKGLNLGLQVDALYDLDLKKSDLLFGFYMRFKERFFLR